MKIPCIDKRSPLQSHKCMQLDKIDCPSKTDLICCQRNWKLKFIDSKLNRNQLFVVEIQGVRHFRVNIPRAESARRIQEFVRDEKVNIQSGKWSGQKWRDETLPHWYTIYTFFKMKLFLNIHFSKCCQIMTNQLFSKEDLKSYPTVKYFSPYLEKGRNCIYQCERVSSSFLITSLFSKQ